MLVKARPTSKSHVYEVAWKNKIKTTLHNVEYKV